MPSAKLKTAVAIAFVTLSTSSLASDWPQFRGPHRDDVWDGVGILEKFPADGIKIEWKRPVGGGWPTPVVAEGRVFLLDVELVKPKSRERLHCFDEKIGKVLWEFVYEEPYGDWAFDPERGAGPTATPIVEGGRIYTVGANGWTHCLDCKTGKLIWEKRIGKEYETLEMSCRPSPLIEGDLL